MATTGWFGWPALIGATLGALLATLAEPAARWPDAPPPCSPPFASGFVFIAGFGLANTLPYPFVLAP